MCWEWCWEEKSGHNLIRCNRLIFMVGGTGVEPVTLGL